MVAVVYHRVTQKFRTRSFAGFFRRGEEQEKECGRMQLHSSCAEACDETRAQWTTGHSPVVIIINSPCTVLYTAVSDFYRKSLPIIHIWISQSTSNVIS